MSNVIFLKAILLAVLDLIIGDTDWATAELVLFDNDYTPNEDTELADLTLASFTGYAPAAITWSAPFFDIDGTPVSSGGEKLFTQTAAGSALIYGFGITNAAGTTLLAAGRFADAPYPMTGSGSVLPVSIKLGILDGLVSVSATP